MNEKNLVPNTERTESEQREIRQAGGRKSGETRRRKKGLKSLMNDLLSGEEEQTPDDGFLSALDGSAAGDWNDEN